MTDVTIEPKDEPIKRGLTSSEFWLSLIAMGGIIASGTAFIELSMESQLLLMAGAGGYTGGRSWLKAKMAEKKE